MSSFTGFDGCESHIKPRIIGLDFRMQLLQIKVVACRKFKLAYILEKVYILGLFLVLGTFSVLPDAIFSNHNIMP